MIVMDLETVARIGAALRMPGDDERELKVSEQEAIRRLCKLMADVREVLGGPADCFCPGRFRDPTGYRNDGTAIAFIEEATRAALAARSSPASGEK